MLSRVLGVSVAGTLGASAYHTRRVMERREIAAAAVRRQALNRGSIEDQVADKLAAGDVLAFERDCSALHVPLALHCAATKQLLGICFDHVGVIFNDRRTPLPMVLEAVPWQGVKATPFAERMAQGDALQVVLMQLVVPSANPHKERRVRERVDVFGGNARTTVKVPSSAKDSVGLVLNALVQARILEAEPALATLSPADLPNGRVRLKDGCWFGEPASLRIR